MATTLATEHYEIPIYNRTDVTSYLTNYNNAFRIVDTEMYRIDTKTDENATAIEAVREIANHADEIAEDAKTDIEEISPRVSTVETQVATAEAAIAELQAQTGNNYVGTLSVGETVLTLTVPILNDTDAFFITPFASIDVEPVSITTDTTAKTVKLTFEAQVVNFNAGIEVKVVRL